MSKFSDWLDEKWGRSAELLRHLNSSGKTVHKNQLSRWKTGKHSVPSDLFEDILHFSGGRLNWKDLLPSETRT